MKGSLVVIVVLALALPCLAQAQPPEPGPEVQRLGFFVGTWKSDTHTVTYEWFTGGFSLIGRVENTGPEGKSSELRILTYDPDAKEYTQYRITSTGPGGTLTRSRDTVTGNTWLSQWDGTESGKPAKYRFAFVKVTPTSFTAKLEVSVADGPWTVAYETKGVKTK